MPINFWMKLNCQRGWYSLLTFFKIRFYFQRICILFFSSSPFFVLFTFISSLKVDSEWRTKLARELPVLSICFYGLKKNPLTTGITPLAVPRPADYCCCPSCSPSLLPLVFVWKWLLESRQRWRAYQRSVWRAFDCLKCRGRGVALLAHSW